MKKIDFAVIERHRVLLSRFKIKDIKLELAWKRGNPFAKLTAFIKAFNGSVPFDRILTIVELSLPEREFGTIIYSLAVEATMHEFHEFFTLDGKRLANPHFTGETPFLEGD